jgi:hypothetical protein
MTIKDWLRAACLAAAMAALAVAAVCADWQLDLAPVATSPR